MSQSLVADAVHVPQEVKIQKHAPLAPYSAAAASLVIGGIYEHYSGKRYQIIAVARHTETLEELAVYKTLYDGETWVRPAAMFAERIVLNGVEQARFQLVS